MSGRQCPGSPAVGTTVGSSLRTDPLCGTASLLGTGVDSTTWVDRAAGTRASFRFLRILTWLSSVIHICAYRVNSIGGSSWYESAMLSSSLTPR